MNYPHGDHRRRVVHHHGRTDQGGFTRGGGRVGFAIAGEHAEEVFAVGEYVGIEGHGIFVQVGAQQLPLGLVLAAEIEGVDQAVAVGILGRSR